MTNVTLLLDNIGLFRDKFGKAIKRDENAWLQHSMRMKQPYRFDLEFLRDFDETEAAGFILYLKHQLQVNGIEHSRNSFLRVKKFLESQSYENAEDFLTAFRNHRRELRDRSLEYMLHYTKDWYLWCANQSLDGFDDAEVYWELRDAVIPGNLKGVAVTTADPEAGPLFEVEENALRAALQQNTLDLRSTALVWLFLTLGPNPMNLALLRESDLSAYTLANQDFYELKVPRIKKRVAPRAEFKVRKIEKFLGAMLVQLRDQNLEAYSHEKAGSRPLFWSNHGLQALAGWSGFERHTSAADLSIELRKAVERLNVISPVTNLTLRITPRRLRYTFAVRMVRQGCDATILAELLDHTDLQNVLVYYANKGAQKRIDDVTNERFGPLAKRFLGRIVKDETEARGTPATRIKTTINLLDLGSCGLEGDCNKAMPYGCYICPKLLAWHDAPHDRFLDEVKKIAKGAREAAQMNDIINAIGEVVQRCKSQ